MDSRAIRTEPTAGSAGPVKRRWRWLRRFLAIAALGLALYTSCGLWLPAVGRWLDVGESPHVNDYCLVLSGDFESRPFAAAALYRKGFIRHGIWLTHIASTERVTPTGLDSDAAARRILTAVGVPDERITILDGACVSTFDEAESLERMLTTHPGATVAVVTSDYHTRRSRWVFRHVLGERADHLQFISVPTDYFNAENWWTVEEGFASYSKEILKLPFYYIRYGWGIVWIVLVLTAVGGLWLGRRILRGRRDRLGGDTAAESSAGRGST
jgi:uncharacterized SAM-binding protein YcdF (DUF218 family)